MVLTTRAGYIFMKETLFKNSADSKESRKKRRMNPSPPPPLPKKKLTDLIDSKGEEMMRLINSI